MSADDLASLRDAIESTRRARREAIKKLAVANTADNRAELSELNDTLSLLRSIRKDEHGVVARVLKRLHLMPG